VAHKKALSEPPIPGGSVPTGRRKRIRIPPDQIERFTERFPTFDPQRTEVLFMMRSLAQRIDDDYNVLLAPYGLTAGRVSYLAVLDAVGERGLPLGELGARVRSSGANISVMVRSLERDGLIRRLKDPSDGRIRLLALTKKGKEIIERAFPVHLNNVRSALKYLTKSDLLTLAALLEKMALGFDALMDGGNR
jgi:MarR family 2-MHQ and catechol resistance regulon transcriptional repressor